MERLRSLIRKRTAVYATEEKALRVMLEGEQEEERKRDREKRLKKEKEKLLQKKRQVDTMLFGGDFTHTLFSKETTRWQYSHLGVSVLFEDVLHLCVQMHPEIVENKPTGDLFVHWDFYGTCCLVFIVFKCCVL